MTSDNLITSSQAVASTTRPLITRIAGSNFSYQHRPLLECLDDMAGLERSAIELWGIAPELQVSALSNTDARIIAGEAQSRGLEIICFTPEQVAYPVNIASPDKNLRDSSIAMFKRAAELAVEFTNGVRTPLLFLTSGRGFESEPAVDAWTRSIDGLGTITDYAADIGIECVLEPLQRTESNLVTSTAEAARAVAEIHRDSLGIVLDTVAMVAAGEEVNDYFSAFGTRVKHVHLVDGSPTGHLALGDGDLPILDILTSLAAHDYHGWMTIELFGDGSYAFDPRPAVEKSLNAIKNAGLHFTV